MKIILKRGKLTPGTVRFEEQPPYELGDNRALNIYIPKSHPFAAKQEITVTIE